MKKTLLVLPVMLLLASSCNSSSQTNSQTQNMPAQNQAQSTPTPTVAMGQYTVTYTDSGFSPSQLTIKKGEAVTFKNQSSGGMSVASNPHPSHTLYPEFDQYKTSQRGMKTFTFTFEKVGSWGYHNHLKAQFGGTIIVK